ncbi:RNA polymerase II subunit A C-terminal domain phosphatase isoform X2 [Pararge aegeria]|uniref:RNA polymerase II subunit A C-terminal domain phosphatase isoform X2 n=1 Tax=Pararge aegeria TaxID=116150 RepID=UPI0019CF5AF7|nr:RNA polymerase II subunit A C-terminal domain phosphatase isoform X2 [Pararge aegeria]
MAANSMPISVPSEKPLKLVKWKVKEGAFVSHGQILFLYSDSSGDSGEIKKYKVARAGTIVSIKVREGDIADPGTCIADLEECRHPTVMKEMCAECGADLRAEEVQKHDVAIVPMVHSVPELKVSEELAQKLGREDADRLLKNRKLVLLVDLDQTLVHTTNDNIPPNLKGVLHFFLRGPGNQGRWCHTRFRPKTEEFLESASKNYELHVCTFGARQYAHAIAELLDPQKKYFSHRILSRDECFDARTKSANLKALFPCGDNMVCIIDDREDVWRHASNLIHVRPYSFFQSTGDINAPPPLPEDKPRLAIGKNGSQLPTSNQMPTLDAEPEKDGKEIKDKQTDEKEKSVEVENGKILSEKPDIKDGEKIDKPLEPPPCVWVGNADGQIEVDDADDYLIYLEDILKRIHKHFYDIYDSMGQQPIPDLKFIIPDVKSKVLAGSSLVFSGLVPTHQRLETSRAYQVAKSLGADVTQDFTDKTTHLVAIRSGTAKVNASRKMGDGKSNKIHVVTPEWLWTCAERWERVDERLYPLQRGGQSSARRPPAHCSSPPPPPVRRRTPSGRFMDSLNPLLSFSSDDIADMDREVEDIFNESDESSSDDEEKPTDDVDDEENISEDRLLSLETSQSSQDRLGENKEGNDSSDSNTDGERPRKRPRPSTPPSDDDVPPDDDDSSWNLMGAALEREFLAQD